MTKNRRRPESTLLGRLRSAVGKIRLLLRHPSAAPWRLIAFLRPNPKKPQFLSFNDRRSSGLIEAFDGGDAGVDRVLQRTTSCRDSTGSEGEEDVDRKAEMFIANFYRQLRLEKQVSLELRYSRGFSFGSYSDRSNSNRSILDSPTTT